jgi:hypothetical protein
MLTKAVAFELASHGIRVNTVMPGPTHPNLGAKFEPLRDVEGNNLARKVVVADGIRKIPMGRYGKRPCKNLATFCKRSSRARFFAIFFDSERSTSERRRHRPRHCLSSERRSAIHDWLRAGGRRRLNHEVNRRACLPKPSTPPRATRGWSRRLARSSGGSNSLRKAFEQRHGREARAVEQYGAHPPAQLQHEAPRAQPRRGGRDRATARRDSLRPDAILRCQQREQRDLQAASFQTARASSASARDEVASSGLISSVSRAGPRRNAASVMATTARAICARLTFG